MTVTFKSLDIGINAVSSNILKNMSWIKNHLV